MANKSASLYQDSIAAILVKAKRPEIDPRWIESYMRLEHHTLDGLSEGQFIREVLIGISCVNAAGPEMAERMAKSYGL